MSRKLVGLILIFAQTAGLFSCQITDQPLESHKVDGDNPEIQLQNSETTIDKEPSIPIQLSVGSFDPLLSNGPTFHSHELMLQNYSEDKVGYYILQFKGPVLQKWKDNVAAAGASFFDYIPKFAFLVKMNSKTYKTIKEMEAVRWVGIYQPGYRIAPDLLVAIQKEENRRINLIVSFFRGENVSYLITEIKHLGGEILSVSKTKQKLRLKIPINKIIALSRRNGIKYIEKIPTFKLSPAISQKGAELW
ncbi:MAG: hypothetical protein JSV31_27245 [Desulfobacterales bacterium]|nr:MAG: hypothetical protein JSV31_27245 [Desulfobacterales bacterium]